ncbi:MAG: tetratricopeptide repeat protein [Gemmatimonadetes bacterium]|nr:MAG: tetratricopeptide repeat protein [Gemmatimonadota bacterium]
MAPKRAHLLFFLSLWGFYVWLLCPTLYWEDSGEFIVAATNLGVAHTPSHPLYVLWGRIFSLLPLGSIAFRLNLMSAVFAVGTVVGIAYLLPNRFNFWGALIAAVTVPYWEFAFAAEVYTLNNFLLFWCLFFLIRYRLTAEAHQLYGFAFFYGLALTNNPSPIFFAPIFALFLLIFHWRSGGIRGGVLGTALVCFVLPLTLYGYALVRSPVDPVPDWGDAESLKNWWWLLSGSEFGPKVTAASDVPETGFWQSVLQFIQDLPATLNWGVLGLAGIGLAVLFTTQPLISGVFVLLAGMNVLFSFRFWGVSFALPGYLGIFYLLSAVFAGYGASFLIQRFRCFSPIVRGVMWAGLVGLVVPNALQLIEQHPARKTSAYHYSRGVLASIPEASNVIYLTENTIDWFGVLYLQVIERRREAVVTVYAPYLRYHWYRTQVGAGYPALVVPAEGGIHSFCNENLHNFRIVYTPDQTFALPPRQTRIRGLVYELLPAPSRSPHDRNLGDYTFARINDGSEAVKRRYSLLHGYRGDFLLRRNQPGLALREYRQAIQIDPENAKLHYNLGVVYQQQNATDLARQAYRHAIALNANFAPAYYNLGTLAQDQNDFAQAEAYYRQAIERDPTYARAYDALGDLYLRQRRFDVAQQMYLHAIEVDSTYADAYKALGLLSFHIFHQPRQARLYLEHYLQLRPHTQEEEVRSVLKSLP